MKEKTSITLSSDVLAKLDSLAGQNGSRSAVIELIVRQYLRERTRREIQARDLDRLNKAADRLNAEAIDVLGYQISHTTSDRYRRRSWPR
jgi:metal-responsive CopG/Arc/MetJ family transcriptional regulator